MLEHRTGDQDLVAATHVCQCWRSTLISNPSLWTCFLFSGPNIDVDRTLTYLERSRSAPIDVRVDLKSPRGFEVFKHLALHIARTRSLIVQPGLHDTEVLQACLLLQTPSPTLQHLEVCVSGGPARLPDNFLGRQAPSLRSITFNGIHLAFESHLPLPSLIEIKLYLPKGTALSHIGALFQFLSDCPRLRKICINSPEVLQDITLDRIISLESLVELDYTCSTIGRIAPCLKLPRLERLRVSPLRRGQKFVDVLPHGGHTLLAGATEMSYYSSEFSQEIEFSGKGTNVSFTMPCSVMASTTIDWFPDDTCVPFGQIEYLTVGVSIAADFPVNIITFGSLRVLRIIPWNRRFAGEFLGSLHPGAEVPCRSLQEIQYPCWGQLRPLISLVRERKRVGHQLALVRLVDSCLGPNQECVDELKEHVGEVRVEKSSGGM